MGLSVHRVQRRLYWTADRSRLVAHGDPAGAFLAFPAGAELSMEEARRYGLLEPVVDVELMGNTPTPGKQRLRPLDKSGVRPADKGAVVERTVTIEEKTR